MLFSRSRTLRVLFTNVSYMNSYASLLLCGHLRFQIINRLSTVSTYVLVSSLVFSFFNKFPENNIFYLYAFVVYEPAERNFIFLACQEHKTRKIIFLIGCISSSLDCFSITKTSLFQHVKLFVTIFLSLKSATRNFTANSNMQIW